MYRRSAKLYEGGRGERMTDVIFGVRRCRSVLTVVMEAHAVVRQIIPTRAAHGPVRFEDQDCMNFFNSTDTRSMLFATALMVGVSGCAYFDREEGTMERMGREVDDSVDDLGGRESTGDRIGESIRDLGDDIEDRS
jgi:hypothetical protein